MRKLWAALAVGLVGMLTAMHASALVATATFSWAGETGTISVLFEDDPIAVYAPGTVNFIPLADGDMRNAQTLYHYATPTLVSPVSFGGVEWIGVGGQGGVFEIAPPNLPLSGLVVDTLLEPGVTFAAYGYAIGMDPAADSGIAIVPLWSITECTSVPTNACSIGPSSVALRVSGGDASSPVSAPATLSLLLAGATALVCARRRRIPPHA